MINLDRRRKILDILEKKGQITTVELETILGVTGATVRNDLREMDREGAIVRFHGGAALVDQSQLESPNENYLKRSVMNVEQKKAIGKAAADMVEDGQTIFLDASSTAVHMIPYLKKCENLTIVTNGIHTAMEIQRYSNFKTMLIGGVLRSHSGAIEGLFCEDMLKKINGDTYFVSGNGFSPEEGLTGHNFFELELKRRCKERCGKVVALVDSSKLSSNSTSSFVSADEIHTLITDEGIAPAMQEAIKNLGIRLVVSETCFQ